MQWIKPIAFAVVFLAACVLLAPAAPISYVPGF